jgi:hypothetical protein
MLNFAVNYLAVLVAAVAGVAINALWYSVILKGQIDALRKADATIAGRDPAPPMYGVAIVGQLLSAFVLAVVLKSTGTSGIGGGVAVGALAWLGLSLPAMAQVLTFGYRQRGFVLVDGANWLLSYLVMGAILGAWS